MSPEPATTVLTPTGMLGYGYPVDDFLAALEQGVDVIAVDSGSTDPGPYQLGLGATLVSEESYLRDLRPLVQAVHESRIPLLISSAGGAGTRAQVEDMVGLVDRLAREEGYGLNVASIYADIAPATVSERLSSGLIQPNVRGELPTQEDILDSSALVAQMGAEPFQSIIEGQPAVDVIVAGRAYDPAPHAAWSMSKGVEPGIAWHMGKILECGGACCEPKGGGVLARVHADSFELTPMSPVRNARPSRLQLTPSMRRVGRTCCPGHRGCWTCAAAASRRSTTAASASPAVASSSTIDRRLRSRERGWSDIGRCSSAASGTRS